MALSSLSQLEVSGRRVLVRADLDVPLTPGGGVADGARLDESCATLRTLLERGARVVLIGHLGAPGQPGEYPHRAIPSLEPVGAYLAQALGREVLLADEPAGDGARKVVMDLREGQLALLENLHRAPGEATSEEALSRALASYADVFVADAFSVLHESRASTTGVPRHVSTVAAGPLVERELAELGALLQSVERPFVAVLGGTGLGQRLAVLESLLPRADALMVGGALGNTFLKARGGRVGRSLTDDDKLATARAFLRRATESQVPLHLPRDVVAAAGVQARQGRIVSATEVPDDLLALDIGPETVREFSEICRRARTVLWAGSLGMCESGEFATGTVEMARNLARLPGARVVAVGAATTRAIRIAGLRERFTHLSSGDHAALCYLRGDTLPGLAALEAAASARR